MPGIPPDLLERLRALPAAGPLAGVTGVHVVGGAVRDLAVGATKPEGAALIGPLEADFVVEGDAVALVARLGLQVVAVHERFGTATVRVGDTVADLASARRERYARPGALPDVELGVSLAEDLERRDFSVNAIAVALDDGRTTAVAGALEDLEAGVLRVLHPASFTDDPTRLLRGARYAARLDFEYDSETAALARAAVAGGALDRVTPGRLGAELRLLLREPQPAAIERLGWGGLGRALLGAGFRPDPEYASRAVARCPPETRADLAVLAASWQGSATEVAARARELGFTAAELAILEPAAEVDRTLAALEADGRSGGSPAVASAGVVDRVLERKPLEVAALVAAGGVPGAAAAARRWLEEDRHRRLAITGQDLLAAGLSGPAVGRGLAAARAAMLDGAAPGRESQLAAALGN